MPEAVDVVCLILGDDHKRPFFVRMEPSDKVMHMKEAIKSKRQSFKEIDANVLRLWKVSEWYLRMLARKI
jgi:hypothetical protein